MGQDFIIAVLLPLKYFPYARTGSLAYFVLSLSSPVDIIHLHELHSILNGHRFLLPLVGL